MELKNQLSLSKIANKMGGVLLLNYVLFFLMLKFVERFLNFEFIHLSNFAVFLSQLILSLILLKVDFNIMFTNKVERYRFGVKDYILLTVLFLSFYRLFMSIYIYVTGYYILIPTMPKNPGFSTNIILNIIQVFIAAACEEIIYRGIFLENLRKYGDAFAIIISGIIFGINHEGLVILKSMAGIILGIIYVLGGNVRWAIIYHIIMNIIYSLIDSSLLLRFPELSSISADLIVAASCLIIFIISLILSFKDKNLRPLLGKWNLKNTKAQFKQDKEKCKEFFSAPAITSYLAIQFITILAVFSEFLNLYLTNR